MLEFTDICCPYCGESQSIDVDLSGGDQTYWQDCQVCCCPMLCDLVVEGDEQFSLTVRREDD